MTPYRSPPLYLYDLLAAAGIVPGCGDEQMGTCHLTFSKWQQGTWQSQLARWKIALHHPEMYAFAAGLSAPLDVTQRTFSAHRLGQSLRLLRVFGPSGSPERRANNVFLLAQRAKTAPFTYLGCGTNEPLLAVNRSFAGLLERRGLSHEYQEFPRGEHSWESWKNRLPGLLTAAAQHLKAAENNAHGFSGTPLE